MSLVQKLRNVVSAHPRVTTTLAVFGIGLAITAIVVSVIGVFDHSHLANAAARAPTAVAAGIVQTNRGS